MTFTEEQLATVSRLPLSLSFAAALRGRSKARQQAAGVSATGVARPQQAAGHSFGMNLPNSPPPTLEQCCAMLSSRCPRAHRRAAGR